MGIWGGNQRHGRQRDDYSRQKQSHAVKRIAQRSSLTHDEIRAAITSGRAEKVGKARYNRDLYRIVEPSGRSVYAVWDARHWAIKTVLTDAMVRKGWGVTLFARDEQAA